MILKNFEIKKLSETVAFFVCTIQIQNTKVFNDNSNLLQEEIADLHLYSISISGTINSKLYRNWRKIKRCTLLSQKLNKYWIGHIKKILPFLWVKKSQVIQKLLKVTFQTN